MAQSPNFVQLPYNKLLSQYVWFGLVSGRGGLIIISGDAPPWLRPLLRHVQPPAHGISSRCARHLHSNTQYYSSGWPPLQWIEFFHRPKSFSLTSATVIWHQLSQFCGVVVSDGDYSIFHPAQHHTGLSPQELNLSFPSSKAAYQRNQIRLTPRFEPQTLCVRVGCATVRLARQRQHNTSCRPNSFWEFKVSAYFKKLLRFYSIIQIGWKQWPTYTSPKHDLLIDPTFRQVFSVSTLYNSWLWGTLVPDCSCDQVLLIRGYTKMSHVLLSDLLINTCSNTKSWWKTRKICPTSLGNWIPTQPNPMIPNLTWPDLT